MDTNPLRREAGDAPESGETAAQATIRTQQALMIGIGDYAEEFAALENAPNDAQGVADLLACDYSFVLVPTDVDPPLLNARASLDTIRSAVEASLAQADATTRWLFYFAGHGAVVDGVGYLLPADAQLGDINTYLSLQWLLDRCLESACEEVLVILDACYSGRALVRGEALDDRAPTADEVRVRQIISSGNPRQPVLDGGGSGHSVFTQALLDGLRGWSGIHEEDGRVRFAQLLDHLVYDVPGRLREAGAELGAAHQQPIGGYLMGNSERREFVFVPTVPRLSPEIVRDLRSEDAGRRVSGLRQLAQASTPETRARAVELALHHLLPGEQSATLWARRGQAAPLVGRSLRYESVTEVRAQAAVTLGELGDSSAVEPLVTALTDALQVCRAAAHALGQLADPRAAAPLLERLQTADDAPFLALVGAIGEVGDVTATMDALRESVQRGRLVPFIGPDWAEGLTGLPDRATVARELARREGLPASDSLADTATATVRGGTRSVFTGFMKRVLDDQLCQPGDIHQALARLSVSLWISGAYDNLLARALNADTIVTGDDTHYRKPDRPTVVRLAGDLASIRGMLVLENDYEQLREDESDRRLLASYLRGELQSKAALFLGYDPNSPDFELLVRHVLNGHLAAVDVRAFLVWPEAGPDHEWNGQPIQLIQQESLTFVRQLGAVSYPNGSGGYRL